VIYGRLGYRKYLTSDDIVRRNAARERLFLSKRRAWERFRQRLGIIGLALLLLCALFGVALASLMMFGKFARP